MYRGNLANVFSIVPLQRSCFIGTNMNAHDAGDLIYILMQRADKSLSISGTL